MRGGGYFQSPISEFRNFISAVLRKKVFLLFLLLCIVGIILQWSFSVSFLPQVYYFGIIFIGFVWSAFQVYRDLSLAHQKALAQNATKKTPGAELSISLINGNEYAFSISDPYEGKNLHITKIQKNKKVKSHFDERGIFHIDGKVYYLMGKGSLEINFQIQNSGDMPLDILSIYTEDNLNLNHLRIIHEGVFLHGNRLQLPLHLKNGELVNLHIRYEISINKGSSNSFFAADFRALPRSISHEISFDIKGADEKKQTYISKVKIPSKPLVDLYVNQWREYDQEEYLIFAGYGPNGDM